MASRSDAVQKLFNPTNSLQRFLPEPQSSLQRTFGGVLKTVGSVLGSGIGGFTNIDPSYQAILQQQIEVQQQMQLVSLHSNIEKSKHETQMAAIRNMRVS